MMVCTVAAIVAFLGYMPPRGTVITTPRSAIPSRYTPKHIEKGQACARKYEIQWVVDESR